ncbi:hypothetical protein TDB9533_02149 [Thalassocella blandensis]|nr:hypothetical protein TDB9533_02149 [Thalassocella blandensis]
MAFDRLDPDLLSALLEAQFNHAQATLFLNNEATPFSSTLLGFDYYENTLLIDGLSPPIEQMIRNRLMQKPFWMQIKSERGYIHISCILLEVQHDLYTLSLLEGELTHNRRWHPRLAFPSRSGPKIKFQRKNGPDLDGIIRDISISGATADFFGKDIRSELQKNSQVKTRIVFNEQFNLSVDCLIKQSSFLRQPCCHSKVRLMFNDYDQVSRLQLQEFIEALTETEAA